MTRDPTISAEAVAPDGADEPALSCRLGDERLVCVMGPRATRGRYMRLLAGVDAAAKGRQFLLGHWGDRLDPDTSRWLRRNIGYIAPYLRLLSVVTGWRNVMLAANYHDIADPVTREQRAQALVDAMPAAEDPHVLPAYMSQLQHMHLAAARALMLMPAFLFAEDPFRGLEREQRARLAGYLGRTAPRYSETVVVSTDDAGFARNYADRVLFVSPDGHFDFDGWSSLRASDASAVRMYFDRGSPGSSDPEED